MEFSQSDIQQISALVASQVVEQLKNAGYQTGIPGHTPELQNKTVEKTARNGTVNR